MKTHPIIFSASMVQALLAGRKTQTRRVVKPSNSRGMWSDYPKSNWDSLCFNTARRVPIDTGRVGLKMLRAKDDNYWVTLRPIWYPGDLLWVRETWWDRIDRLPAIHDLGAIHYVADGWEPPEGTNLHYKRSSAHMPRWASRITLRITDVSVERVQEIISRDARREGLWSWSKEYRSEICKWRDSKYALEQTDLEYFKKLWDSIYGPGSWERDRKSTRLNSSHIPLSRMPSSA